MVNQPNETDIQSMLSLIGQLYAEATDVQSKFPTEKIQDGLVERHLHATFMAGLGIGALDTPNITFDVVFKKFRD